MSGDPVSGDPTRYEPRWWEPADVADLPGPAEWEASGAMHIPTIPCWAWITNFSGAAGYHRLDGPARINLDEHGRQEWWFYVSGSRPHGAEDLLEELYRAGRIHTLTSALTLWQESEDLTAAQTRALVEAVIAADTR